MMTKVTLRNLAAHKIRLVLTALSVILGVAFVSGTLIFTDTANKSFDTLFTDLYANTDVAVRAKPAIEGSDDDAVTAIAISEDLKERVAAVPGVKEARGEVNGFAALINKDGDLIGGGGPPQLGLAWNGDQATPLIEGKAPAKAGEVALGERTAELAEAKIGDQVRIAVRGGQETATVTGIASGDDLGVTFVFFDLATAQKLLLKPGQLSLIVIQGDGSASQQDLAARVAPLLPAELEAVTGDKLSEETRSDVDGALSVLRNFLLAFAIVSIVVGSFNIFNTFSMLIGQRTRELALLRAVGASRRQVTTAVLGEAVAVGVIGSTLGLLVGAGIAALLKVVFAAQGLELGGDLAITPAAVIMSYTVGVLVTCAAAYFPARRAAKIPPVAAMRDDVSIPQRSLRLRTIIGTVLAALGVAALALGLSGTGSTAATFSLLGIGVLLVWLAAAFLAAVLGKPVVKVLAAWYPKVFGVSGKLARENPQRNPRRTAVTAVALMIGLSLVTTVNVIASSARASVNDLIDRQFGAHYNVFTMSPGGVEPAAVDAVRAVPGITKVVPIGYEQFSFNGENQSYASGEPADLLAVSNASVSDGTATTGPDGVLLSEGYAKDNKLKVGAAVPAVFADGTRTQLKVTGIFPDSEVLPSIILSPDLWHAHTDKALAREIAVNAADPGPQTKQALEDALKPYPGVDVMDQADLKEMVSGQLDGFLVFFTFMLALSIVIAVFGVINTITLSVTERTRELGLLRAVGLSRRQTRRMIRLESVVIALFGGILGIGLGLAFGIAIQQAIKDDIAILSLPYGFIVACVVFSALVGIFASLAPAWRAGRMDVLKAIATE
ncbi:ABC transporter permease [Actinocorallia sp. API 0066]|uniref:ABC transporter permease n=1 Tax=Actinocorallia sp. API 0066 TaxID=2896846 RepID=UPI001E4B6750|nr:FtsX-like permease family protein [Actinocorallia sp. API 0066]MCD0450110.1 ABC transporter permease [Actinocorallia sp. API 0066]